MLSPLHKPVSISNGNIHGIKDLRPDISRCQKKLTFVKFMAILIGFNSIALWALWTVNSGSCTYITQFINCYLIACDGLINITLTTPYSVLCCVKCNIFIASYANYQIYVNKRHKLELIVMIFPYGIQSVFHSLSISHFSWIFWPTNQFMRLKMQSIKLTTLSIGICIVSLIWNVCALCTRHIYDMYDGRWSIDEICINTVFGRFSSFLLYFEKSQA